MTEISEYTPGSESKALSRVCRSGKTCKTGGCHKLDIHDWLSAVKPPEGQKPFECVEVRFKNSRKLFFRNTEGLKLRTGEPVAIEAVSGHDVGLVSATGELARLQMKKKGVNPDAKDIRKIYRTARYTDIEKWKEAQSLEQETMLKARTVVADLGLEMKIGDVEYQADKTKATFYYTADERVDFRELIKILAEKFKVRIEMRQIGARQEAGKIGGIGDCGRELCCCSWFTDFRSVATGAARSQQLALNPVKLTGQCSKLKCCLNYELDAYLDALKEFPNSEQTLQTKKGSAVHQKTDIFKRMMWYSYSDEPDDHIPLSVERVEEIISMNAEGRKPSELKDYADAAGQEDTLGFDKVKEQDSITRFDRKRRGRRRKKRTRGRKQ